MTLSQAEYLAEMRSLEEMRNEAKHLNDKAALIALRLRARTLNQVFWNSRIRFA